MRPVALTGVLAGLTVVVVAAVPPVRRGLRDVRESTSNPQSKLSGAALERVAQAHPNDAAMWLGYGVDAASQEEVARVMGGPMGPLGKTTAVEAYDKALQLDPSSPSVHLGAALYHLSKAGELLRPEEASVTGPVGERTEAQVAELNQATALLEECRQLAPTNPAIDYLLAWALFADRRDTEAFAALPQALTKEEWSLYQGETAGALLTLLKSAGIGGALAPIATIGIVSGAGPDTSSKFREVARLLSGLGGHFAGAQRPQRAIFCCQAALHLGHVVRVRAHSLIDGLVGVAVTQVGVAMFLSETERQGIIASAPDKSAREDRLAAAKLESCQRYLRRHGRPDLAEFCAGEVAAATAWRQASRNLPGRMMAEVVGRLLGGGMMNAMALWAALALTAALGVIVGIASLIARSWREAKRPLAWGYGDWLVLLLVLLAPAQIAAGVVTGWASRAGEEAWSLSTPLVGIAVLVGLAAWLAAIVAVALRRRSRLPERGEPGRGRAALAALRALVLPTIAALLLLSAISLWPVHQRTQETTRQQEATMVQGEVEHWGIGQK